MQDIVQIITKLEKQGRCVLNCKFRCASVHSASRNMLTCLCDAAEQCQAEAADHFRMIVWERLRGAWDRLSCTSYVGRPPVCERATATTSRATTTSDAPKGRLGGK